MDLPQDLEEAIGRVADLAVGARDRWWIIGSAAAAVHGAGAGAPRDIDLLTSPRDAAVLLRACGVDPRSGAADDRFRSTVFGTVPLSPLPLEVMGGLHLRTGSAWSPLRLRTRERLCVGGGVLYVPAAAELLRLFRRFGREKDLARAAALEARLKEKG